MSLDAEMCITLGLPSRAEAQEALGAAKLKDSLLKAESHTTIDSR